MTAVKWGRAHTSGPAGRVGNSRAQAVTLLAPPVIIVLATWIGGVGPDSVQQQVQFALANVVIVIGLQLFVGGSGVLSLGHIGFVAVGAWVFGILTTQPLIKHNTIPSMSHWLTGLHAGFWPALLIAGLVSGLVAGLIAPVLMRLNGLQAAIATLAFLYVVNEVLSNWSLIGPGSVRQGFFLAGAQTSTWVLGGLGVAAAIVSWLYQRTRSARMLRASRESLVAAPASGIHVLAHRCGAWVLSAFICGVGGALTAQVHGSIAPSQVSGELTFFTLLMLVLGGMYSLWGAVIGTAVFSLIDVGMQQAASGITVGGSVITVPSGAHDMVLGAVLGLMLVFRPEGITRGYEASWPRWLHRRGMPSGPPNVGGDRGEGDRPFRGRTSRSFGDASRTGDGLPAVDVGADA